MALVGFVWAFVFFAVVDYAFDADGCEFTDIPCKRHRPQEQGFIDAIPHAAPCEQACGELISDGGGVQPTRQPRVLCDLCGKGLGRFLGGRLGGIGGWAFHFLTKHLEGERRFKQASGEDKMDLFALCGIRDEAIKSRQDLGGCIAHREVIKQQTLCLKALECCDGFGECAVNVGCIGV